MRHSPFYTDSQVLAFQGTWVHLMYFLITSDHGISPLLNYTDNRCPCDHCAPVLERQSKGKLPVSVNRRNSYLSE
jgi:hypothetical protein